jgi:ectoine hydroxylase-related dioxygenase (phytanoyl-CoA dioxygenase family)
VDAFDTNTIWVETDYGRGDYVPVPVSYGEILLFDGGWLLHGSVPNTTPVTRVSFDFRFAAKRADLPNRTLGVLDARPAVPPPSVVERLRRAGAGVS